MFSFHDGYNLYYKKGELPLDEPNRTASIAFSTIFCLWIASLMPNTLVMNCALLVASLGRIVPLTPWSSKVWTYCGNCTEVISQFNVSSTVQLCTGWIIKQNINTKNATIVKTELCFKIIHKHTILIGILSFFGDVFNIRLERGHWCVMSRR